MTTKVDPIDLQVINTTLTGIVREMQLLLFRTGYSTAIRETQDASCAILDRTGRLISQYKSLYMHLAITQVFVEATLESYAPAEMEPGDAFILNHPYHGNSTHVSDMAVVVPVFYHGNLVAFCTSMAHKPDIGGSVPGSASGTSTEIFQEGLLLPPVRYLRRGEPDRNLLAVLTSNTRAPEMLIGDINGQIGTCRIGEERINKLMDKYGEETVQAAFDLLIDKTEEHVRSEIKQWNDGTVEVESFLENDGVELNKPVRLHLRTTKEGNSLVFDFTGCGDQTLGPMNLRPAGARSACCFALITMVDPNITNNEGLARAMTTKFRKHSVLCPDSPAPVSCYSTTVGVILQMVVSSLARLRGERAMAYWGKGTALTMGGKSLATGSPYIQYELQAAGAGAVDGDDGPEGIHGGPHGCNKTMKTVPLEILESEFASRILRYELIPDTGGAGKFRGGLGSVREYLIMGDEARAVLRGGKIVAPGAEGGLPGAESYVVLNPGTPGEKLLPRMISGLVLKKGDVLRLVSGGGGGVGDPETRERQKVLDDIRDGYVSVKQAQETYGVEVTSNK